MPRRLLRYVFISGVYRMNANQKQGQCYLEFSVRVFKVTRGQGNRWGVCVDLHFIQPRGTDTYQHTEFYED